MYGYSKASKLTSITIIAASKIIFLGQSNYIPLTYNSYLLDMLLLGHTIIVSLSIAFARSQDSATDSTCSKQPIVQNFYSSDISSTAVVSNERSNVAQGRPGRIGPPGLPGPKGSKV